MLAEKIFGGEKEYAELFDRIEQEATDALKSIKPEEDEGELTEEEALKMSMVVDYKYRAQEFLETSYLFKKRIQELV